MKQVRLALSGSGFLGPIHAGAVCALMDAGVEIVEVSGSSGGSIVASLVAVGMDAASIKRLAMSDIPKGIIKFQPLALFKKSINSGEILHQWLKDVIGPLAFSDAKIPVTVMATDIEAGKPKAFNSTETPGVLIADACRASASVPFVWQPAEIDGRVYVDSGVVNNIPVDHLISDDIQRVGIQVEDGSPSGSISTPIAYAKQCLNTMLAANENNIQAWAERTGTQIIQVDANPYDFLNPSLTSDQKSDLFSRGYFAVTTKLLTA